jgi:hypothetical protein
MKTRLTIVALLVLTLAACGGDTDTSAVDDGTQAPPDQTQPSDDGGGNDGGGDGAVNTDMDPNFDVSSIPDDFPSELFPSEFDSGMYGELGGIRNANFLVSQSLDDVVADYTDRIGETPIIGEGEQRIATWIIDGEWAVSAVGDNPTLIGISHSG